jgi:hypothetical protein
VHKNKRGQKKNCQLGFANLKSSITEIREICCLPCSVFILYISSVQKKTDLHVYLQEKFPVEQLIDRNILDNEPVKPPALDDTPFTFVDDLKTLEVLATKLKSAIEFAVSSFISTNSAMSFFSSLLVSC